MMKTSILAVLVLCVVAIFGLSMADVKVERAMVQQELPAKELLDKANAKL